MIDAGPPPSPPAIVRPAEARTIMAWGNPVALESLRQRMEKQGWRWATAILGEKTPALFLSAPERVQAPDISRLINGINKGHFGKINADYGFIGLPVEDSVKPDDA